MGNDEHGPAYPEPSRAPYICPICKGDKTRYLTCAYPACPDGRDQSGWVRPVMTEGGDIGYVDFRALFLGLLFWIVLVFAVIAGWKFARAMDHGFDPLAPTTQWMEKLQRPNDRPGSCCGAADAYQADIYRRNPDGSYDVVITDGSAVEFPDGTHRTPLKTGTELHVEADHVNPPSEQAGNPTGHAWLFMSVYGFSTDGVYTTQPGTQYCFVPLPEGS